MQNEQARQQIIEGRAVLGIEFGSTRIKAVLIGSDCSPIAQGAHDWENRFENGYWTYSLDDITTGLQHCYAEMAADVMSQYGVPVKKLAGIGVSAMMHGYMPFDKEDNLLVPFRTWRNTTTGQAADALIKLFDFNIPQRWSIAHLYQAMLGKEPHVSQISSINTLAGYIHYRLTGRRVLGVGDASGMFPIDQKTCDYNEVMLEKFRKLVAADGYTWDIKEILPAVLSAGEPAGSLTAEGAAFLDVSGQLEPGALCCPPEGDAGTGMAATNSVAVRTGNVSAGTSAFAMIVLEKDLSRVYPEIDIVTTPTGEPVAMVHENNCTSETNAWANLFKEFAECMGVTLDMGDIYTMLYNKSLEADIDCGGLMSYGYLSGEFLTGFDEGRPLFVRMPDSRMTLANFMRTQLFSAIGAMKVGLEILDEEKVGYDSITGHGGFFKTPGVGQRFLAAAMNTDISVMETAGEGGPWGMALLASYAVNREEGEALGDYLSEKVFGSVKKETVSPIAEDVESFGIFMARYKAGLAAEKAAVEALS